MSTTYSKNHLAVISVAQTIRSCAGPNARSKLIVRGSGDVIVSSDGATVMKELSIGHPAAKLLTELSESQDAAVGDGTTSVVVFCGALCEGSMKLLDRGMHHRIIARGYQRALRLALTAIRKRAIPLDTNDLEFLSRVASTSLGSRIGASHIASLCVRAVSAVWNEQEKDVVLSRIRFHLRTGLTFADSTLVYGAILHRGVAHDRMPTIVTNARIAVLSCPLEPPRLKTKHSVNISSVQDHEELTRVRRLFLEQAVSAIEAVHATVVVCQWGIESDIAHLLATKGIMALSWIPGHELEYLALATNASICARCQSLTEDMLGFAGSVEQQRTGTDEEVTTVFSDCNHPRSVCFLVRGGNETVCADGKSAIFDCINVFPGGGCSEMVAAAAVTLEAETVDTAERDVLLAWASAVQSIPAVLATNAGAHAAVLLHTLLQQHQLGFSSTFSADESVKLVRSPSVEEQKRDINPSTCDDSTDTVNVSGKERSYCYSGIDREGNIADMRTLMVLEPLSMVESVLSLATETACLIASLSGMQKSL